VTTTALTVTVEDAEGNLIPNAAVTLTSSGAGDVFGATNGLTNALGVFTTAHEGAVHEQTTVSFTAGAASAATSSITAAPATVAADGVTTTALTVTVE